MLNSTKNKLEAEIYKLTDYADTLESQIKELKQEISTDDVIIAEFEGKVSQWKNQYLALQKSHNQEIQDLKLQLADYQEKAKKSDDIITTLNLQIPSLKNAIKKIKAENLTIINSRPLHNQRGAGRKSRITPEIKQMIIDLKSQNITQSEIAKKLTASTGEHWSRSTVGQVLKS